jgi:type 1 glutamine amidotransferase
MKFLATVLLLSSTTWLSAQPAGRIRVQLTTGGHPHDLTFYHIFDKGDDLEVTVNPHPSAFQRDLRNSVDVLVLYDMTETRSEQEREVLRHFVEAGKGLVILHHAIVDNQEWPWWYQEVSGGVYFEKPRDGHPASRYKHDVDFAVRPVGKPSIIAGIQAFPLHDEVYKGMWISPDVIPLLETDNPDSDRVIAWISPYQKSRVVVIQPGHGPETHQNLIYRKLVHNAILWASGRLPREQVRLPQLAPIQNYDARLTLSHLVDERNVVCLEFRCPPEQLGEGDKTMLR